MTHLDPRALEAAARALIDNDRSISGYHPWHIELMLPAARAAVTAYLAALQETHALVPREATEAMLEKAYGLDVDWRSYASPREVYRAMIDAAPPAAQEKK